VHRYFTGHADNCSPGVENLLVAQSIAEQLGRSIFRMPAPPSQRVAAEIERGVLRPEKASKADSRKYQFDVAFSAIPHHNGTIDSDSC